MVNTSGSGKVVFVIKLCSKDVVHDIVFFFEKLFSPQTSCVFGGPAGGSAPRKVLRTNKVIRYGL